MAAEREPAWDAWFSVQYDLWQEVKAAIENATKGRSPAFRAAVVSSLIESLAEDLRSSLALPAADADAAEPVDAS